MEENFLKAFSYKIKSPIELNKYFKKNKFISTKFFFDLELIHLYSKKKLKIVSVKTIFNVPKKSSIKIFNLIKNYYILKELIKILLFYSKAN